MKDMRVFIVTLLILPALLLAACSRGSGNGYGGTQAPTQLAPGAPAGVAQGTRPPATMAPATTASATAGTPVGGTQTPGGGLLTPTETPRLVRLAQDWLTFRLGVSLDQARMISATEEQWPDSCLGVQQAGEACSEIVTPGWLIIFDVNGRRYEVHTDRSGQAFRLAPSAAAQTAIATGTSLSGAPTSGLTQPGAGQDALKGTSWTLSSMGPNGAGLPALSGVSVTLDFQAGGEAGGSAGCNSYGGEYVVSGTSLMFKNLLSTMMACTDTRLMDQEQQFLNALRNADRFQVSGDLLTIYYNNGEAVMTLTRS